MKLLGEGNYGKAYLAERQSTKKLCVIKMLNLNFLSDDEKSQTIKEAKILENLRHPNIIKFREIYKTKKQMLCIVMDYAQGGDLDQKIHSKSSTQIPETQILD